MFRIPVRVIGVGAWLWCPLAFAQVPILPSGGDDTAALNAALTSCVPGGPGCTVWLGAGTFRTTQILLSNFNGTLIGAGMGQTIVEPFGRLHVSKDDGPSGIYSNPPSADHPYPFLITLLGSDITASDLTFRVPLTQPTDGWYYGCGDPSCYVTWLKTIISVDGSGRFERVEFAGAPGPGELGAISTVNNGPDINGSTWGAGSGGELILRSSRLTLLDNGFEVGPVDGLRAIVGGSPQAGNVFRQSMAGIFFMTSRSEIEESYNEIDGAGLVALFSDGNRIAFRRNHVTVSLPGLNAVDIENYRGVPVPAVSTVLIDHNDIDVVAPGAVAMYLDDRWLISGIKAVDAVVSANQVNVADPSGDQGMAGIWLRYLADALVEGNRVSGTGCTAFYLGRISFTTVKANNLANFFPNDPTCVIPPAVPMFFYVDAHDNLVLGGGRTLANSVLDWGVNNTLVGVNAIHGNPPGPRISDAMDEKRIVRRTIR